MKASFTFTKKLNRSGTYSYRVRGLLKRKRIEKSFKNKDQAKRWMEAKELEAKSDSLKTQITPLTENELREAEVAYHMLKGRSLFSAVDFYLKTHSDTVNEKNLYDAYIEFLGSKEQANARPLTIKDLRLKVGAFVNGYRERQVNEVTSQELRSFLDKPGLSGVSINNYRRALMGFFNWCKKQDYRLDNPVEKIEIIKVDRKLPEIFSLKEVTQLINEALKIEEGAMIPYVSIGLFAGLRPFEMQRISWAEIDLDERLITLQGKHTKNRNHTRHVDISENLLEWLLPARARNLAIYPSHWLKLFKELKDKCKMKRWPVDIMRHTYGSNHYRNYNDIGLTAAQMGNSPDIIFKHYRNLVKPKEAALYWEILPNPNDAIRFKQVS